MTLGKEIRLKRRRMGLTQSELARKVGLSRQYICDIERNRYTPSLKTLVKISRILELDINFLISMTEIQ